MKNLMLVGLMALLLVGCSKPVEKVDATKVDTANPFVDEKLEVFTLAWSEYPSWSIYGVASDVGIINGEQGKLGEIEKLNERVVG